MATKKKTASDTEFNNSSCRTRSGLLAQLQFEHQECDRLRSEVERYKSENLTLRSAAAPVTTVVGVGALARCLGYSGSMMLSLVHDGMPHTMQDGTTVFDLPKVHRWFLDRRERRATEDCRAGFDNRIELLKSDKAILEARVGIQASRIEGLIRACPDSDNMYLLADTVVEAIEFITEEMDQTMSDGGIPGKPESILDDEHFGPRLTKLADLARRLREAHADIPLPAPFSILEGAR